jgi:hypothetical protein
MFSEIGQTKHNQTNTKTRNIPRPCLKKNIHIICFFVKITNLGCNQKLFILGIVVAKGFKL